MQFFECTTVHDRARRLLKELRREKISEDIDSWYKHLIKYDIDREGVINLNCPAEYAGNSMMCLKGEAVWYANGKPYYKIFPHMASMMSEVSIDIPSEVIRVPYQTFAVLLSDSPENDFFEKLPDGSIGPRLKWISVHEFCVEFENNQTFKVKDDWQKFNIDEKEDACRGLYINYEFEGEYHGEPNQYNYTLSLHRTAGTVSEFFEDSYSRTVDEVSKMFRPGEYQPSKDMIFRILRLAVATAFFGIDRHEVVMPDLPRKKLEKKISKHRGDAQAVKDDIRHANLDTVKWTIGREISLPRPIVEKIQQEGQRKGISHSYLKRGHMRWQAVGEKHSQRKLMFIHPHFVKPDLPMNPNRGFKIPDQKVSE